MSHCHLVTPNLVELAVLAGSPPAIDEDEILRQGQGLLAAEAQAVLIKGGHASGRRSTDILLRSGQEPLRFDAPRLAAPMRGTGCMLASATAAYLSNATSLEDTVRKGKLFVFESFQKIEAA